MRGAVGGVDRTGVVPARVLLVRCTYEARDRIRRAAPMVRVARRGGRGRGVGGRGQGSAPRDAARGCGCTGAQPGPHLPGRAARARPRPSRSLGLGVDGTGAAAAFRSPTEPVTTLLDTHFILWIVLRSRAVGTTTRGSDVRSRTFSLTFPRPPARRGRRRTRARTPRAPCGVRVPSAVSFG